MKAAETRDIVKKHEAFIWNSILDHTVFDLHNIP